MNRKIVVGIIILLMLQGIKALIINDYKEVYGESRIECTARYEGAIDYEKVKRSSIYNLYLPVMLKKKTVSISKLEQPTIAIGTTAEYNQLAKLKMVEGSFIVNNAVEESRNVVVISDKAAKKLFGSTKVVGKVIECNGMPYNIVGVYKKYIRVYEYIIDNGHENIYIPITVKELQETAVGQVIFNGTYIDNMPNQVALGKLNLSQESIRKNDYVHWIEEANSLSQYPIVVAGILLCIMGVKKTKQYKSIRKISTIDLGCILAGIMIFWLSVSKIYINPERLPVENIFDIPFYLKQFCNDQISYNLYMIESISRFGQLLHSLKQILQGINLIQCMLLIIIFYNLKLRIKKI